MNFKGKELPLIGLENLFSEFNVKDQVYVLYILMEKATTDLKGILKNRKLN